MDRDGKLLECRLSERRDLVAVRAFFEEARKVAGITSDRVTTDGHDFYPGAIAKELGEDVVHRRNRYRNYPIELDHRGIKQRYRPMCGLGAIDSAERFCRTHDEAGNFYRPCREQAHIVSLADRCHIFRAETDKLNKPLLAAA